MTAHHPNPAGPEASPRGELLLVEGDASVRESLRSALESEGFGVSAADLGLAAVHRYAAGRFDLVLLDVSRPGREGWDLLAQLRAVNPEVGVVVLTVRSDLGSAAAAAGALAVCEKPLAMAGLVEVLSGLLARVGNGRLLAGNPQPMRMPSG